MVSSRNNPKNNDIYVVDTDLGSSIFYNDIHFEKEDPKEIEKS